MAKYKICPSCHEKNAPSSLSCINCDMDLSTVKITDDELEAQLVVQAESAAVGHGQTQTVMVKICDCGAINPAQARKCQECGEDLSDVVATPRAVSQATSSPASDPQAQEIECHYILSSVTDGYLFQVPCSGILIGREQGMRECLVAKQYVSRVHAKLTVENGDLYIENLSMTNFTYVNNIRIPQGKVKLNVNDEIGLGGIAVNGVRQPEAAYFIVGVSV